MLVSINLLSKAIHLWAKGKGFWDKDVDKCEGTKYTLMMCELAEAFEGLRHGNPPSEHIPDFTSEEEEMADLVIRILDYCGRKEIRLGEAISAKMNFNVTRPYRHGKVF